MLYEVELLLRAERQLILKCFWINSAKNILAHVYSLKISAKWIMNHLYIVIFLESVKIFPNFILQQHC